MRRALVLGMVMAAASLALAGPVAADFRSVTLVSPGGSPGLPVTFDAVAGNAVFFSTSEALSPDDTDGFADIYRWDSGTLSLMTGYAYNDDVTFQAASETGDYAVGSTSGVSPGEDLFVSAPGYVQSKNFGGGAFTATFKAATPDVGTVVFETSEDLTHAGDEGDVDVFRTNTTSFNQLVSAGAGANGDVLYAGASTDLDSVYLKTDVVLSPDADQNFVADIYLTGDARTGSATFQLVSNGTGGPDTFEGASSNGRVAYWSTEDNDTLGLDDNGGRDLYRFEGTDVSKLVSGGDPGDVTYGGTSNDARVVYFSSPDPLVGGDGDHAIDVYRFDDGAAGAADDTLTLMSGGAPTSFAATYQDSTSDGVLVILSTRGALPGTGDVDSGVDLYQSTGSADGDKILLSGSGSADVGYGGMSADGDVYFTSPDRLTAADSDDVQDVYVNEGGSITLVSGGTANISASFAGADDDVAVFSTTEQLTSADTDATSDLYTFGPVTVPPPPPPADTAAPLAATSGKAEQKNNGKVKLTVTCGPSEPCNLKTTGTLKAGGKSYSLKGGSSTLAPNAKAKLKLTVPTKAKNAAAAALKAGKKVKGTVKIVVFDVAGNSRTLKFKVRLE